MVNEDSSQIAEQESWNSKSKYEQTYRGVGTSCILVDFESKDKIQGVETNLRSDLGKPKFEEIMQAVIGSATVKIPKVLIEQEVDRLLSQTLDEIKRLGLTLDQYLASTGKTPEQLRVEYAQKSENDIKLEFVLQKISEAEKITVEEKEVDEAIQKAKDPKEKENLTQNRYMLTNILRQQKTLDFLRNL